MEILENRDLCYGCGACANICRYQAVTMEADEEGFLYPVVDEAECENCGACRRVCPRLNASYENAGKPQAYAVMAEDEIRAKSASGGMFTLLADYVLERGGCVCGAAFTEDFRGVRQIMISGAEELEKLRRSKYLQSENGDIYRQVKKALDGDAWVLFVGTPCQCAALKCFLCRPYEKLILADLICHSTPSPMAWNRFLDEIGGGKKIAEVNFRYKGLVGWSATTYVKFADGKEYLERFKNDTYEQASSKGLISRKSCGTCQFARVPRQGDITMGDFWGVTEYDKKLNDKKGTSIVLANSFKGGEILRRLEEAGKFKLFQKVSFTDVFTRRNANVYHFPQENPGRSAFFNALERGKKFSEALELSMNKKYDIVLFSIWYAANYGSLLTNYALYSMLGDLGYRCIFADIPDHLWPASKAHRDPLFVTRRFGNKYFHVTGKYQNRTALKKLNSLSDTFLVGSDQIWNYKLCKSADTYFFLDFVDEHKRKISYGTSFGHDKFSGSEEECKRAGFYLNRFDAVSVREDYAVDLCRRKFGVHVVKVLDPVFMCDKKHYLKCIRDSRLAKNPPKHRYLLAYILDPNEAKQRALENAVKKMGEGGVELICIPNASVKESMRKNWRLPIKEDLDVEDWLYYFQNAEFVITDSFHGTCFSIIFERQFISIVNRGRGRERFYSLLGSFSLLDRLVESPDEIMKRTALFDREINYADVNKAVEKQKMESMSWLLEALKKEKAPEIYSGYDMADRRMDSLQELMSEREAGLRAQIAEQNKQLSDLQRTVKSLQEKINQGMK